MGIHTTNMNEKKTIAVLGGSFDPPTIAHIQIIAEVYNNFPDIDECWIVPCGDGRDDKSLKTAGHHRLNMLKLILNDLVDSSIPIKINDYEIETKKYWNTYKLLEKFGEPNPNYEFHFCLGTDLINGLHKWNYGEK